MEYLNLVSSIHLLVFMLVFCFFRVELSESRAFGVDGLWPGLVLEEDSLPRKNNFRLNISFSAACTELLKNWNVSCPTLSSPKITIFCSIFAFYGLTKFISIKRLALTRVRVNFLFLSLFWILTISTFHFLTPVWFSWFSPLLLLLISGNCVLFKPGNTALQIQAPGHQQGPTTERRRLGLKWQPQPESHSRSIGVAKHLISRYERSLRRRWELRLHHRAAERIFDTAASGQKPPEASESQGAYKTIADWALAQPWRGPRNILHQTRIRDNADAASVANLRGMQLAKLCWQPND